MYSNDLVCNILIYINNNYKKDISIDEISNYFSYNRFYIMKLFKREIDDSIINYINKLKIYKSIQLLDSNKSILNISISSGFNSLEYYSEIFKKYIGISPNKYKNLYNLENKDIVINNVNKIRMFFQEINNYLCRQKPKILPVYKRGIFK